MTDDENRRAAAAHHDLLAAVGGFIWLGDNLHNIKTDPDNFRRYYEAALVDAKAAYTKATGEPHD